MVSGLGWCSPVTSWTHWTTKRGSYSTSIDVPSHVLTLSHALHTRSFARLRLLDAFSLTDGDEDVHATCKGRLNADYLIFVTTDFFSRLDQKLNMQKIQEVNSRYGARGVIVTTKRGGDERGIVDEWDIKSRFFCPNAGIPEDPVTGSSFPTLAAFYKLPHFVGLQDHPRRRGFVHVSMLEDGSTAISGDAVMVTTNHFLI